MLLAFFIALTLQTGAAEPPAGASPAAALSPGTSYDAAIPTLRQVVGHDLGDEVTPPDGLIAYLEALHRAAPSRTRLVEYARSWEGRRLVALVIGSPERMAQIDAVQSGLRRLADPRGLASAEADRLIAALPVVVALLHGVHGNEISSAGAALGMAYHLLAAQQDPVVDLIRREALVIIDPAQNPDGRARFVASNTLARAADADPHPVAAEHDEPWPGGRSNHYLFDLNRDWFAQTQPESAGRVKLLLDWTPQVVADLHEMGGESTYYFPPAAAPGNPHVSATQRGMLDTIGRAIAARFDARGFPYFVREVFDAFYPGYGVSWPSMHGGIGMTFEKASARGLAYRRQDGTFLTLHDGILEHFTAALATAETAARHRERLLREFLAFRRGAVADGETGTREYLLTGGDQRQTERLARLLVQNGAEVRRLQEPVTIAGRTVPGGAFVVPLAQPSGRLVRNLLDPQVSIDPAFLQRQDERRKRRLPDEIYDVTAWSLPLLWDVEAVATTRPTTARSEPYVPPTSPPASLGLPEARVGYLLPWNATTVGTVIAAQQAGLTVRFTPGPFTLAGRRFGAAAFLRTSDHGPELRGRLAAILGTHGSEVVPMDSAFVEDGISLGSTEVSRLKTPRVLLLWDTPASSLSAGWARYVLERRYGQPVTAVRAASLARVDLREFDVVVIPSGNYGTLPGTEQVRRLKEWMQAGGTLITLAEASRWAAREQVGLLDTRTELKGGAADTEPPPGSDAAKGKDAPAVPIDYDAAIAPARERPEVVPGALLRVDLDLEHWLAAGTDGEVQAQVDGQRVFTPIRLDKGRNVGVYAAAERVLASGVLWPESRDQIARKAFLVHQPVGRGHLVAFAEDPNTRAYAESTMQLFMNAVVLGPSR